MKGFATKHADVQCRHISFDQPGRLPPCNLDADCSVEVDSKQEAITG